MPILSGIKIVEIEGIGPAPFCGMHLADLGADVVLVQRPRTDGAPIGDNECNTILKRGKRIITLDLKNEQDQQSLLELIKHADGLIEGMRPGVMERLGLGPDICHEINPALAYGRITGWGQDGPLSQAAGHDINYIALSSALWYSGKPGDPPFASPTMVGDIGGGALYLTIGMLACILSAKSTGKGDVIDAAIVDGTGHMMNLIFSLKALGQVHNERGVSILDGPHWFDTYACKDGKFISVGSLEVKFYQILLERLGLQDDPEFKDQYDARKWPEQKQRLTKIFKTKTQAQWCDAMEGSDACFAPVLNPDEAAEHPHIKAREIFSHRNDNLEANSAPRFKNHPTEASANPTASSIEKMVKEWS